MSLPCGTVLLVVLSAMMLHPWAEADMFSSVIDMERALHAEHGIAHDLRTYVDKERSRLNKLDALADEFERHSAEALSDTERYLSNPVNAFQLIKKFTLDWDSIVKDLIQGNSSAEFMRRIVDKTCDLPEPDDLVGAAIGLHRLQDTYNLSTSAFANGDVPGITNSQAFTADDCFEVGRIAYNYGDHYHTILWMSEALERLNSEVVETTNRVVLLDYLAYSFFVKGNIRQARNLTLKWLELAPDDQRAHANLANYDQEIRKAGGSDEDSWDIAKWKMPMDKHQLKGYEDLCRGDPSDRYLYRNKLTCQYRRHHPIFYLKPALEETVNLDPNMYVYHSVLTDTEINKIKELATPKLHRSLIFTKEGQVVDDIKVKTTDRTSKSAWIEDVEDPLILRVSVKTSVLSNLTRDTVEPLQVLNYGIGGHYLAHCDFALPGDATTFTEDIGNRIATTIFYASDVEAGGCTAFPRVGVRVCPEKGAMALWYNLQRNGEGDQRTLHAACPVLSGIKWVATKWYHTVGNEFARQCGLDSKE